LEAPLTEPRKITQLLAAYRAGDAAALDRLLPLVYDDLRRSARRQLRRRPAQGLQTTSLVHEAYLRLADQSRPGWRDRHHFQAVAALAMRHVLIDLARKRAAQKRGADPVRVALDEEGVAAPSRVVDVLAVDEALRNLAALSERLAKVVELRFFGGLTLDEAAEVLGISPITAKRDWRKARAFLYDALHPSVTG